MNPAKDGLPSILTYKGKTGDEMLLFLGIQAATTDIWKGRAISADAYRSYRLLIQKVGGLKEALDNRERLQGANDD